MGFSSGRAAGSCCGGGTGQRDHEMAQVGVRDAAGMQVRCAFCQGTGKDPFGIMSWLSSCCVCLGRGTVTIKAPYVPCAHCKGTGAVKTLTCTTCGGKGVLPATQEPTEICPECKGTGDDSSIPTLDCLRCRGRGRIPAHKAA
jgi:hypothetical protein